MVGIVKAAVVVAVMLVQIGMLYGLHTLHKCLKAAIEKEAKRASDAGNASTDSTRLPGELELHAVRAYELVWRVSAGRVSARESLLVFSGRDAQALRHDVSMRRLALVLLDGVMLGVRPGTRAQQRRADAVAEATGDETDLVWVALRASPPPSSRRGPTITSVDATRGQLRGGRRREGAVCVLLLGMPSMGGLARGGSAPSPAVDADEEDEEWSLGPHAAWLGTSQLREPASLQAGEVVRVDNTGGNHNDISIRLEPGYCAAVSTSSGSVRACAAEGEHTAASLRLRGVDVTSTSFSVAVERRPIPSLPTATRTTRDR